MNVLVAVINVYLLFYVPCLIYFFYSCPYLDGHFFKIYSRVRLPRNRKVTLLPLGIGRGGSPSEFLMGLLLLHSFLVLITTSTGLPLLFSLPLSRQNAAPRLPEKTRGLCPNCIAAFPVFLWPLFWQHRYQIHILSSQVKGAMTFYKERTKFLTIP